MLISLINWFLFFTDRSHVKRILNHRKGIFCARTCDQMKPAPNDETVCSQERKPIVPLSTNCDDDTVDENGLSTTSKRKSKMNCVEEASLRRTSRTPKRPEKYKHFESTVSGSKKKNPVTKSLKLTSDGEKAPESQSKKRINGNVAQKSPKNLIRNPCKKLRKSDELLCQKEFDEFLKIPEKKSKLFLQIQSILEGKHKRAKKVTSKKLKVQSNNRLTNVDEQQRMMPLKDEYRKYLKQNNPLPKSFSKRLNYVNCSIKLKENRDPREFKFSSSYNRWNHQQQRSSLNCGTQKCSTLQDPNEKTVLDLKKLGPFISKFDNHVIVGMDGYNRFMNDLYKLYSTDESDYGHLMNIASTSNHQLDDLFEQTKRIDSINTVLNSPCPNLINLLRTNVNTSMIKWENIDSNPIELDNIDSILMDLEDDTETDETCDTMVISTIVDELIQNTIDCIKTLSQEDKVLSPKLIRHNSIPVKDGDYLKNETIFERAAKSSNGPNKENVIDR